MAQSVLLWKTRRRLLESRKAPPPSELTRAGRELLAAGRPAEAWEFFKRSGDKEALEELRRSAVEDGDFFLYTLAAGSLGTAADAGSLGRLAANARAKGLELYARKAEAAAGIQDPVSGGEGGASPDAGDEGVPDSPGEASLPA
ncbi:MAG: hypothetical protein LBQ12_05175 [Deltaproteobacteria bacterium]|jgi:hypothetical protein|nr:hypothetical protein [Deltaproteobacteria bacterium]